MRSSFLIGSACLLLGIGFGYASSSLIQTAALVHTSASFLAALLFVIIYCALIGTGFSCIIHFVLDLAGPAKTFFAQIILSAIILFVGIGATLATNNWWTALQLLLFIIFASITLFFLAFISLFGGLRKVTRHIKTTLRHK